MKNIHVLPTDKPSRLHITSKLMLYPNGLMPKSQGLCKNQNIYITSNEEIKEGDYGLIGKEVGKIILTQDGYEFLIGKGVSYEYGDYHSFQKVCKKIILTTDQYLIKDGVQAIDDEFLEWFVKNPSCEFVEVEKIRVISYSFPRSGYDKYRITIPKEEPKFEDSIENSLNIMSIANDMFGKKEEPKQYTEKEVSELLETQRGNSYVAILSATKDEELASIALNAPEPGGKNGTWKK